MDVPPEILLHVFSFLTPRDLGRATCVCWTWYSIAIDDTLWKELAQTLFVTDHSKAKRLDDARSLVASRLATEERWLRSFSESASVFFCRDLIHHSTLVTAIEILEEEQVFLGTTDGIIVRCILPSNDMLSNLKPEIIGTTIASIPSHVRCMKLIPHSSFLVAGSLNSKVYYFDIASADYSTPVRVESSHNNAVMALEATQDNRLVFTGSGDSTIRITPITKLFSSESLDNGITLTGHKDWVWCLGVDEHRGRLISGATELMIWDLGKGGHPECIHALKIHSDSTITSLQVLRDGQALITSSLDKTVVYTDLRTNSIVHTIDDFQGDIYTVRAHGYRLASGENALQLYDIRTFQKVSHTLMSVYKIRMTDQMILVGGEEAAMGVF